LRQKETLLLFLEEAENGQVIAQDANASFGGLEALGDLFDTVIAFVDCCEQIELNGGLQRSGLLMRIQRLKNVFWRWRVRSGSGSHARVILLAGMATQSQTINAAAAVIHRKVIARWMQPLAYCIPAVRKDSLNEA
jgi:hypothetical protein